MIGSCGWLRRECPAIAIEIATYCYCELFVAPCQLLLLEDLLRIAKQYRPYDKIIRQSFYFASACQHRSLIRYNVNDVVKTV
jgi:hypothetical protein